MGERILVVERHGPSGRLSCFLEGLRRRSAPPVYEIDHMGRTKEGEGRGKARVQFCSASQEIPRLTVGFLRRSKPQLAAAQEQVIGFQIVGVLSRKPPTVGIAKVECERGDDLLGHVVLDGEDVCEVSVKSLCPEMAPV